LPQSDSFSVLKSFIFGLRGLKGQKVTGFRMILSSLKELVLKISIKASYSPVSFFVALIPALVLLSPSLAWARTEYVPVPDFWFHDGYCRILMFSTSAFGAILMSIAGILSIISAAAGNYRTAMTVLTVACGCWSIESLIDLFFDVPCNIGSTADFINLPEVIGLGDVLN